MHMNITYFLMIALCIQLHAQKFSMSDGSIHFVSNAPLEIIEARSSQLKGILDMESRAFAFEVVIHTFEGFNSPLQQTHFFENYMETKTFPKAQFVGKVLEPFDPNSSQYRAKGRLTIHGVTQEVLLPVVLHMTDTEIQFESDFIARLNEYNIRLPRIVYQKVAESIEVNVKGSLLPAQL